MPPTYITTKEAADIIGVSVRRIQAMLNDEQLAGRRFGRDWQVVKADAERVAAMERKPGRPPKTRGRNA
jgi:excisionase family DNA binding protein